MKGGSVEGSAGGGDMGSPRKMTGSIGRQPTSRWVPRALSVSGLRGCPGSERVRLTRWSHRVANDGRTAHEHELVDQTHVELSGEWRGGGRSGDHCAGGGGDTGVAQRWLGVGAATLCLAAMVFVLGPTLDRLIPLGALRVVIGTLLLIFGLQWLRKAMMRLHRFEGTARWRGLRMTPNGGPLCPWVTFRGNSRGPRRPR